MKFVLRYKTKSNLSKQSISVMAVIRKSQNFISGTGGREDCVPFPIHGLVGGS